MLRTCGPWARPQRTGVAATPDDAATREVKAETPRKPRGGAAALLAAMRPRQWTKNLIVYAALIFSSNRSKSKGFTS